MRSSRWQAQGNVYLVTDDEPLTPDGVRSEVGDADGILEVFRTGDDWLEIAIWNPDGSRAEMSGNGTRIAASWLAERTGADEVVVRVGPREVHARHAAPATSSSRTSGAVSIGEPEEVEGIRLTTVDVGNPHAVVEGDPAELPRIGPLLEVHERFPRPHERAGRAADARTASRHESGSAGRGRPPRPARAPSRSLRRSAASRSSSRSRAGS